MITYKLKQPENEGDEVLVVKEGEVTEFKISDVGDALKDIEKSLKEWNSEAGLKKAEIENIEHFHPEVKELSPEKVLACKMYIEKKMYLESLQRNIDKQQKIYDEAQAELAEIAKQTGHALRVKTTDLPESPVTGEEVTNSEAV